MKKKEITELFRQLLELHNGQLDLVSQMEGSYTLEAQGLVKKYGKRTVVNDVNYTVRQGEIVGLLGPNGAGKTTSFYMTTGLVLPNGGQVFVNDGKERREITNFPVYKRAQEASVFRKMTVEDNIFSVLEMRKVKPSIPQNYLEKYPDFTEYDWKYFMMEDLIHELRLNKVRRNKGDQLSGGERRRCEIARCLAINPRFIMLDEPFAGVDPIAVEDIQFIVWNLKKRNIGILITDHNVEDTLCITDRAYLLFEGRILFHGSPEELAANSVVREKYLTNSFVLRQKDFQKLEEERRMKEETEM